MDRREAPDIDVVSDGDMAAQRRIIGHGHIVADPAVMGDMDAGHEIAIAADVGRHLVEARAAVHGDVLAQHIAAADLEAAVGTVEADILRRLTQGGKGMDLRPGADMGAAIDDHMGMQPNPRLDRHFRPDAAIGADLDIVCQLCSRRDDRGGVDPGHVFSRTMAAKTASATTLSPTFAVPLNFQTGPRLRSFSTRIRS